VTVSRQQQQRRLRILPAARAKKNSDLELSPGSLRNSFRQWLGSMGSQASANPFVTSPRPLTRFPKLTALEIMRVNHATIREGESHCIWPPAIVRKFHTAQVITEKQISHYQLRDVNLRRVK